MTLPVKWVKCNDLEASGEVEVVLDEDNLVVLPGAEGKRPETSISFDISEYNERTIRNILYQSYRKGYDRMDIVFKGKEQVDLIQDVVSTTLLGFQVTEESVTTGKCVIQNIAEPSSEKYEVILRKVFLLTRQEAEEMLDSLRGKSGMDLKKRKNQRNLIDTYTNFLRRVVINDRMGGRRNSYLLFYAVAQMSLIHHAYYYMHEYCAKNPGKVSPDVLELLSKSLKMLDMYYDAFYKKDITMAHKIGVMKDRLQKEIYILLEKKKGKDNVVLYHTGEAVRLIQMSTTVVFGLVGTAT
jgi:hypothetical protein